MSMFPDGGADMNDKEMSLPEEDPLFYQNLIPNKKKNSGGNYIVENYCLYCGKAYQKLSRHLLAKHKDEANVVKAMSFSEISKERLLHFQYIKNKGNLKHETNGLKIYKCEIIPWKPKRKSDGRRRIRCEYCYTVCLESSMKKHRKICKLKDKLKLPKQDLKKDVADGVTATSSGIIRRTSARFKDKETAVNRSWTPEECAAVQKHLSAYIEVSEVPGSSNSTGFFSSTKRKSRGAAGKKRDSRKKKGDSSKKKGDENEETSTQTAETDGRPEETPVQRPASPPEEGASPPEEGASPREDGDLDVSFSDYDDMNVDFNLNSDTGDDDQEKRNEENGAASDVDGPAAGADGEEATPELNGCDGATKVPSPRRCSAETSPAPPEDNVSDDGEAEQADWDDVDHNDSSSSPPPEKKNLSPAEMGIKEVRVLITKLDMANLQASVYAPRLSSPNKPAVKVSTDSRSESETTAPPTEPPTKPPTELPTKPPTEPANEPSSAKVVNMICSHCKKNMMKGQTAFQKKGFTDVFCSKNCLFEMFPYNKAAVRTCHYCCKEILQPLDLIMAVVDPKGTMKDFCSPTCLCSFKSEAKPRIKARSQLSCSQTMSTQTLPSLCSTCKKTCTTSLELSLQEGIHSFCSETCLEVFCRDNVGVCENCSSVCRRKPLKLRLQDGAKSICDTECLEELRKGIQTPHQCTLCHCSKPMSRMVVHKSGDNVVELFCSAYCVRTHKLVPTILLEPPGKKNSTSAESEDAPTLFIATSDLKCCICKKKMRKGCTVFKLKNPREAFCSAACLSEKHPNTNPKKCHNCSKVIERPQSVILSPVDSTGTMMELCSEACLSSIKSKRMAAAKPLHQQDGPSSLCKMCGKYCYCSFNMTLRDEVHSLCSESCLINYHKVNNIPCSCCDMCGALCPHKWLTVKLEDGPVTICGDDCLHKFKEKVETPQLCSMCHTPHKMLDMLEKINPKGKVDFFCSYRCVTMDGAQSLMASEMSSVDSDEVKPLLPSLGCLKEEPVDEEYDESLANSVTPEIIKDEPKPPKEELTIDSIFSLVEDSKPVEPAHVDVRMSCSLCSTVLTDGETVYQRKGHEEIFCSTPCLLKFYQMKKKTCHFCLQVITKPEAVLQASVDDNGTKKHFCTKICLSSFNYKKIVSPKAAVESVGSHSQCSMCTRYCISKHEPILHNDVYKICSDPCLNRFCNINNLHQCDNCRSCCASQLTLKTADGDRTLCGAECLAQFKLNVQTPQQCAMCCTSHLMSDMVENRNGEDVIELLCTNSCMMASKIQAISASGESLNCDNCSKMTIPACHLAMPDASIRNFCTLTCAMAFKDIKKDVTAATNSPEAQNTSHSEFDKPQEKLLCAECERIIKAPPIVVQTKGRLNFVCSLDCSQDFKKANNMMRTCEYCKSERIMHEVKRIDNKDCSFCSDGCRMHFENELEIRWGKHCHSCTFCLSVSKNVLVSQKRTSREEFCSQVCSSNYKSLISLTAKCDECGRTGRMKQSLPLLGDAKHFCTLKCLLRFCNKSIHNVHKVDTADAVQSSPVITSVISLSNARPGQPRASDSCTKLGPFIDIQTKVVGHASVQTFSKELKNKSTLCVPLVHNKGVSCSVQTVETGQQTDCEEKAPPRVSVLPVPVPVPVFIPVPMTMYSQYAPKPVALPIPLPVPMFFSEKLNGSEPTETVEEKKVNESIEANSRSEPTDMEERIVNELMEADSGSETDGRDEGEDGRDDEVTKEDEEQKESALDHLSSQSNDSDSDYQPALNELKALISDTNNGLSSQAQSPAPDWDLNPSGRSRTCQTSTPLPSPLLLQRLQGRVPTNNKGCELQLWPEAEEEMSHGGLQKVMPRKPNRLKSQCGVDAWRKWIQWRESQTQLGVASLPAVKLKADILRCSSAELSNGLCLLIAELRQPQGELHSPDGLFYLCLSIQQYLFENGRVENIFSDRIYQKFSVEFTDILKQFRPSLTASGLVHSRVEEKFLWDCKQLGAYSPIVLLNTLLFFCCKYFGLTTVEQHRRLSFANIRTCVKTNGDDSMSVVRFYQLESRREAESDSEVVPRKKQRLNEREDDYLEIEENTENPLRCPVRLFEFYLSKCSESVRRRSNVFYLLPDRSCAPSHQLWFSSTPLDDTTLEAMIVRTLIVRELQSDDRGGT